MAGFDDAGLYYHDRFFADDGEAVEGTHDLVTDYKNAKSSFRNFIREFAPQKFEHIYRDQLKRRYNLGEFWLDVNLDHLRCFDESLYDFIRDRPNFYLPCFEEAAKEVANEITRPRPAGQEDVRDIQVQLHSPENALSIRDLQSQQVSKLVKLQGIIIAASQVRSKATRIAIECRNCGNTRADIELKAGLDGYALPRKCNAAQAAMGGERCPIDPYHIVPDKCKCVDFQTLKLQENPERVPHGEMPRHMQLYVDRNITDLVAPGNRVTVTGVYSIKKVNTQNSKKEQSKSTIGLRAPYLRVVGIQVESSGPGRSDSTRFSDSEEEQFRKFASRADAYDCIAKSIAPFIWGSEDIKKAVAMLLFGGARKCMPDGLTRRGDINLLLLGDPGTAKSQLLKFVERVAPIAVYTSGKGSSAAGLTASVIRDPSSVGSILLLCISQLPPVPMCLQRNFIMEGGAMVLADGGVVCIDEFDKMRPDDTVAIHEAMEQQTISIAKAGITTTLNSRCSVLAAANSVFGRWDDTKGADNIEFLPTILSRFDMIFVVKDEHDMQRDMTLAKHVIGVHVGAASQTEVDNTTAAAADPMAFGSNGEMSLLFLKRFIAYCRCHCGPRLSESAASKLMSHYVQLRNPTGSAELQAKGAHKSTIPITVRQLEALVRMAESLAKMQLRPFANEHDVDEALRLFRASTLKAAATGNLAGVEGFTTERDHEAFSRIEKQIKKRFSVGTQVSEHIIVQDFVRQNYTQQAVQKVLAAMIRRGEIQHRMQRRMLFRIK